MTKQQEIIRVLKRGIGKTKGVKLNMKILFFQAIEGIKTLKIEGIGYNVGGH
jgi:thiamine pyrophosphokinase